MDMMEAQQREMLQLCDVFEFMDVVLIRFWGQKVKGRIPKKSGECNIFVTVGVNFTKIRAYTYLDRETCW